MQDYEFHLSHKISVAQLFNGISSQLGGDMTMYGGSAGGETVEGNTFLCVLQEKGSTLLGRLYHVNPHAGRFNNINDEETNHITITAVDGEPFSDAKIKIIKKYLERLL